MAAPLLGVAVGAWIGRMGVRKDVIRQRVMDEITHRRQVYADFSKKLWAYKSRVQTAVELHEARVQVQAGETGDKRYVVRFDPMVTKRLSEDCITSFADLEALASHAAQVAARDAMEAVTDANNKAMHGDIQVARTSLAASGDHYKRLSEVINQETGEINKVLDVMVTPLWSAIVGKLRGKALPFVEDPLPGRAPSAPVAESATDPQGDEH